MCVHDYIDDIVDPKKLNLGLLEDLIGGAEDFPLIGPGCTENCKKRMIEIVQITMGRFTELVVGYFQDARVGADISGGQCDFWEYVGYCQDQGKNKDEYFIEMVEKQMNLKIIDGKVIHLNPDGTPRDTRSQDLTSNLQNQDETK
ncbi:hypothetical protein CYY_009533 [Polysphondylium violaceum]|uniref:Uncharacterized protein n=1 Tax=Polysphondylium violaceum TaxID=133409 RepID=A0A8J4PK24_9MYCE|nr:hypothetical protein CYY_009533 [Polysphondylium violaceum]